mmetsp:Transcript_27627/g.49854  ORF Transcript_27627/g.49854 Transcript_27627/m.49854 type:complete len:130 (+) Transcript_27627:717-1106(+)
MLSGAPPFYSKNKEEMYRNIMNKPVEMKPHFSPNASDLLRSLMKIDSRKRLADAAEVKRHPFFETINWEQLAAKEVKPPFKPKVMHNKDLRNFDRMFTDEKVHDTPVESGPLRPGNKYQGFTYEDPSQL